MAKFKCHFSSCNKEFEKRKQLFKHHYIQHSLNHEKKNTCSYCSYQYNQIKQYVIHLRLCHPNNLFDLYKCTYCEKRFTLRKTRSIHIERQHVEIEREKNEEFSQHVQTIVLKQLSFTEFKQKNFACRYCADTFRSINEYTSHVKNQHQNDIFRIFSCQFCDKKFGTRNITLRHEKTHLKTWLCKHLSCNQIFNSLEDRSVHYKTHVHQTNVPLSVVLNMD